MNTIVSAQNTALKHLAKLLQQSRYRRAQGQAVLEGAHLLDAFLNAGGKPLSVWIPFERLRLPESQALLARVSPDSVFPIADAALAKISALVDGAEIMTLIERQAAVEWQDTADCVVLERVQDPGNVGTILRSAAAAGIRQIVVDSASADVFSPKVYRAAMGAHFALQILEVERVAQWCAQSDLPLMATALSPESIALYDCDLLAPCAWLFGNEGSGLSEEILALAQQRLLIPMPGMAESLNVAMAATVCFFEQARQRRDAGRA